MYRWSPQLATRRSCSKKQRKTRQLELRRHIRVWRMLSQRIRSARQFNFRSSVIGVHCYGNQMSSKELLEIRSFVRVVKARLPALVLSRQDVEIFPQIYFWWRSSPATLQSTCIQYARNEQGWWDAAVECWPINWEPHFVAYRPVSLFHCVLYRKPGIATLTNRASEIAWPRCGTLLSILCHTRPRAGGSEFVNALQLVTTKNTTPLARFNLLPVRL
jgi:hypothetical protein